MAGEEGETGKEEEEEDGQEIAIKGRGETIDSISNA